MEIQPNVPLAGAAGTARSQAKGTDADRPATLGGVAESRQISDNDRLDAGTRSEDRDADGRQLLGHFPDSEGEHEEASPASSRDESHAPHSAHPPSTDPHRGHRLDFDA